MKTLTNPSDDELNAAFAVKVAGWRRWAGCHNQWLDGEKYVSIARFTHSADAVLPWLEKDGMVEINRMHRYAIGWQWEVRVWGNDGSYFPRGEAEDKSSPRAAVIALLRAHGVVVEFTT